MSEILNKLAGAISEQMAELKKRLVAELDAQGHRITGNLEKSITYTVKAGGQTVVAEMTANTYGVYLEFGVKPERIPYGRGGGKGGKSKYIQGLVRFFQLRGLNDREALGAAFATAKVQGREGMPTRGSFAFSSNNRRTAFIRETVEAFLPVLRDNLSKKTGLIVDLVLADTVRLDPYKIAV